MELDLTKDFLGVTEFRSVVRETIERVEKTKRPLILTKGGKPSAVLLDVESYQDFYEAFKQSENLKLRESVNRAENNILSGKTHSHTDAMEEFKRRKKKKQNGAKKEA